MDLIIIIFLVTLVVTMAYVLKTLQDRHTPLTRKRKKK